MICRNCGDKFDLNAPDRGSLVGGRFQPHCKKCAEELGREGIVCCVSCGEENKLEDVQTAFHQHQRTNEIEPCIVCSQSCTQDLIATGQSNWREFGNHGAEMEPPQDYEKLVEGYEDEVQKHHGTRGVATVEKKYAAFAAAHHITTNYRATATIDTRLTPPSSEYLPIVITPKYGDADDEYISKFDRVGFDAPGGRVLLKIDKDGHQAFGVCLFEYEITGGPHR